jgi:hypothetical protein
MFAERYPVHQVTKNLGKRALHSRKDIPRLGLQMRVYVGAERDSGDICKWLN